MLQKIEIKFFISYIIAFDLVAVNSHYYKKNTGHRQLMRQQTFLRSHLRTIF